MAGSHHHSGASTPGCKARRSPSHCLPIREPKAYRRSCRYPHGSRRSQPLPHGILTRQVHCRRFLKPPTSYLGFFPLLGAFLTHQRNVMRPLKSFSIRPQPLRYIELTVPNFKRIRKRLIELDYFSFHTCKRVKPINRRLKNFDQAAKHSICCDGDN